jgi:hypothetical protein
MLALLKNLCDAFVQIVPSGGRLLDQSVATEYHSIQDGPASCWAVLRGGEERNVRLFNLLLNNIIALE